jgi:hypothetical protein
MNIKKTLKRFYAEFISLKGEPREIAISTAIGVLVGVMPVIPFHTVLIILLGFLLRQNITAAILSSWIVSNPVTIPFLYTTEYHLGKFLLDGKQNQIILNDYAIFDIFNRGLNVLCPLLAGGLVLAIFFAIPAYFITYRAVLAVRKRHGKMVGDE